MGGHKGFDHYSIVSGGQMLTFRKHVHFPVGIMVGSVQKKSIYNFYMLKVPLNTSHVF